MCLVRIAGKADMEESRLDACFNRCNRRLATFVPSVVGSTRQLWHEGLRFYSLLIPNLATTPIQSLAVLYQFAMTSAYGLSPLAFLHYPAETEPLHPSLTSRLVCCTLPLRILRLAVRTLGTVRKQQRLSLFHSSVHLLRSLVFWRYSWRKLSLKNRMDSRRPLVHHVRSWACWRTPHERLWRRAVQRRTRRRALDKRRWWRGRSIGRHRSAALHQIRVMLR